MKTPEYESICFLYAVLTGMLIGISYDIILPLRKKHTNISDAVFVFASIVLWLWYNFKICRGDIRLSYHAGVVPGFMIWRMSFSRYLCQLLCVIDHKYNKVLSNFKKIFKNRKN